MYLEKSKTWYFSIPKVACSSLKGMCFQAEFGTRFQKSKFAETHKRLHDLYPSERVVKVRRKVRKLKKQGVWTFTVVRHPVDRIISCYESKVLQETQKMKKVSEKDLEKYGISREPSLAEFIEKLDDYCKASWVIKRHAQPLHYFLGKKPDLFDRIFDISEMDEIVAEVNKRAGSEVALPWRNKSGIKVNKEEVTPEIVAKIEKDFASDLELFGDYLGPSKYTVS